MSSSRKDPSAAGARRGDAAGRLRSHPWRPGERERVLPRLVAVPPADLADPGPEARARVTAALERALAAERRRARVGHWTYGLARHVGLVEALAAERASALEARASRRARR